MKRLVVPALFLLLLALLCVGACAEGIPAVERQEVRITLVPEQHLLRGESTVVFASAGPADLALAPTARIDSVTANGAAIPYSFKNGRITFTIPEASPRAVAVQYRVSFNDPVADRPTTSEDPTYGVSAAIAERGTFLGSGSGWYPVPREAPRHRTVRVNAPAGIEAVTFGRRVSRSTAAGVSRSEWEETHPVGELSLSAGNYRIEESSVDGIALYTYFYPDNAALSHKYLEAAARYIKFYAALFGPYPFEKFAVVENFFPTGYGMPSYTLLGSTVIRLPFIIDTSFPHEIAHSWWGNGIEIDPRQGNWCEGLVSYLADYYLKERRSPAEAEQHRRQLLIDYAQLVAPDRDFPLTRFTSRVDPASRAVGYGKAAMLFHMIRTRIGDEAFFGALREIVRTRRYGSASWTDFVNAFSKSAGTDLHSFIEQWLTRTGAPRLSLADVTLKQQDKEWKIAGKIVQKPAFQDFCVPLVEEGGHGPVKSCVTVEGESTPFQLTSETRPTSLALDPGADVFRLLDPSEIPVTVNSIKGSHDLVAVITKNCRASAESVRDLLESLDQKQAPVLREEELGQGTQGKDLVFCGAPANRSLIGPLPAGTALFGDGFTVEGEAFQGEDALLFLTTRAPGSQRIVAVFEPLSERAATSYGYKITHYGKYGYLAFGGGAIRRKGTVRSAAGDSLVHFPAP
ncbi:M1 family metallopeptidase [Geomesophilobacter sediminis]|uniref:M1 family metallopeptidase n=1 Tax=Geomesophilobacter sediminis TaxID=2798584 RepID=UPI002E2CAF0F|nr:M1 family aminopeptidase [Geomesophilobacter sediminis]